MVVEVHVREEVYLPRGDVHDMRIMSACIWTVGFAEMVWGRDWLYETHPTIPASLVASSDEWVRL